jgi:hypothetical protein
MSVVCWDDMYCVGWDVFCLFGILGGHVVFWMGRLLGV